MSLTKAEMADRLFDEVGLNKREAKEFVDAFFEAIRTALEGLHQLDDENRRMANGYCDW